MVRFVFKLIVDCYLDDLVFDKIVSYQLVNFRVESLYSRLSSLECLNIKRIHIKKNTMPKVGEFVVNGEGLWSCFMDRVSRSAGARD